MPDTAPEAQNVHIDGASSIVGTVLTGDYTYSDLENDPEGGTTFQWYRGDSSEGPWVSIPGATGITYTATEDDVGKYLSFEVTPGQI